MRTAISILLLLLFTAQTEVGQIFRIPFAVQHYLGHRQQTEKLSFIQFIKDHYNTAHHDEDKAADQQLPFNHYNSQILTLIYVPAFSPELVLQPVKMFQKPFAAHTNHALCQRARPIFHPPPVI